MTDSLNPSAPTRADIARALNISAPRVTQLAAAGMPVDSIERAKAWRAARDLGRRSGIRTKSGSLAAAAAGGATAGQVTPRPTPRLELEEGTLSRSAMRRLRQAEEQAWETLKSAQDRASKSGLQEDYGVLPGLLRNHALTAENYNRAARQWERHNRSVGTLVPMATAHEVVQLALEPLVAQLETFARTVAHLANPAEPPVAERAIREGLEHIRRQVAATLVTARANAATPGVAGPDAPDPTG